MEKVYTLIKSRIGICLIFASNDILATFVTFRWQSRNNKELIFIFVDFIHLYTLANDSQT